MENNEAYRILTRELTNMHHTERTVLDTHPSYQAAMDAVKAGNKGLAVSLAYNNFRTDKGDAYRVKNSLPFTANAE